MLCLSIVVSFLHTLKYDQVDHINFNVKLIIIRLVKLISFVSGHKDAE